MTESNLDANLARDISRENGVWSEFLASKPAVVALTVLVGLCVLALFAPLISPQNAYDLAVIDVREGRQPPGSVKYSKRQAVSVVAATGEVSTHVPALVVRASRVSDQALTPDVRVALMPIPNDALRWRLQITLAPDSVLLPVATVTIDGLPSSARLSARPQARRSFSSLEFWRGVVSARAASQLAAGRRGEARMEGRKGGAKGRVEAGLRRREGEKTA